MRYANCGKGAALSRVVLSVLISAGCISIGFVPPSKSAEWIRTRTGKFCIYEVDIESIKTVPPGITSYNTRARCEGEPTGPLFTGYAMCKEEPPLVKELGGWIPIHDMVRDINTGKSIYSVPMHAAPTVCQYEGIR